MPRAAVLLIEDDAVALIERLRGGRRYFVFPGGGLEPGETLEQAAVRETYEELGLRVEIDRLVAEVEYRHRTQYYFLVRAVGGEFGTGQGDEMTGRTKPQAGTHTPVWVRVDELLQREIHPRCVAELVAAYPTDGWPAGPVKLIDPARGY